MSTLGDDELSLILNWVSDQDDRKSFSQVCKQWLRVEGLTRLHIRVLEPDLLPNFLPRFPNLISFESPGSITDVHLRFVAETCPDIEVLNLHLRNSYKNLDDCDNLSGFEDVGDDGLCAIGNGCRKLSRIILRKRRNIGNDGVISIVESAQRLRVLDLGRCNLIDDRTLEAIAVSNSIRALSLEACSLITDQGLAALATGYPSNTLKKLVLAECDRITDSGVSLLPQMCCLEEVNLAECGPKITDSGGVALALITSLKRLNLAWLINVSDTTLIAIAENCLNLVSLDLTGCESITGVGVSAFGHHGCLEYLAMGSCYNISGEDLDIILGCQSLRDIVLDRGLRMWIPMTLQENIGRVSQLHWR